jgi:hypothetical protein
MSLPLLKIIETDSAKNTGIFSGTDVSLKMVSFTV